MARHYKNRKVPPLILTDLFVDGNVVKINELVLFINFGQKAIDLHKAHTKQERRKSLYI